MKKQRAQATAEGRRVSVLHFHFKQTLESRRSIVGLLRSLLIQLVEQDDTILAQLYKCLSTEEQNVQSWEEIDRLASDALKPHGLCFVVIDGLDECVGDYEEGQRMEQTQVIEWFEKLVAQSDSEDDDTSNPNIRLFISGQRNGILDARLSGYPSIQLESASEHARDIESYARERVKDIGRRFGLSSQEEVDLVRRTATGAKGHCSCSDW